MPDFWLGPHHGRGLPESHIAFTAPDRAAVDAFLAAARPAGRRSSTRPGSGRIPPNYYGAFLRDPDGNNVEAVCHRPG